MTVAAKTKVNPGVVDEHAARELYLYATNDSDLYRQQITPINKNLITKKARGVYNTTLAVKLAMYLMDNAAKKYARESGSPGDKWSDMFNVPTRREAAKEFVEHFENEAQYGNYDNLLPAKYQKNPSGRQTLEGFRYKFLEGTLTIKDVLDSDPKLTRAQAEKTLKTLRAIRPKKTDQIGKREYSPHEERNPNTSTSTEVRSPTSTETSTEAYTADNVTVTGGAGAGATTKVTIIKKGNPGETYYQLHNVERPHVTAKFETKDAAVKAVPEFAAQYPGEDVSLVRYTYSKHSGFGKFFVKRFKAKTKRNATANDFRQHQKIRLETLAKMFQGEATGEKRRVLESDYTPKKKYRLGYLKLLKFKSGGKIIPIIVEGDEKGVEAYVAADLRNNLLIVGRDARMEGIRLPKKGFLRYLGELIQVDYVTAKKHIGGGKLIHFYHKLGEVTGEHPNLFVDDEGCLIIQGGGYDVWDVGIVN